MKNSIYIGSDHGGFELKEKIKTWLEEWGYGFEDLGAYTKDLNDDYPEYAFLVAKKVVSHKNSLGVLLCRSGGGMVIAANKVNAARAVSIYDQKSAVHAREHNNANIVSISADWTSDSSAKEVLKSFFEANFSGEERHIRRINEIREFENSIENNTKG